MQQLTIRMPEEYFYKIELIAKSSGLKKSDITRMAIRKFLEEYNGDENTDLYGPMGTVMNKCISHFKLLKFISRANFFPRSAAWLTIGCQ